MSPDPKFQPWQSPYCSMDGNPINLTDIMGDCPTCKEGTNEHIVKEGETLSEIATANHTTVKAIKDANTKIDWSSDKRTGKKKDWIYAEESLIIPPAAKTNEQKSAIVELKPAGKKPGPWKQELIQSGNVPNQETPVVVEKKSTSNVDIKLTENFAKIVVKVAVLLENSKDISDPIKYPGVKIYETTLMKEGTGVTLPGIGIFIYPQKDADKKERLLQHEYGHFRDYINSPEKKHDITYTFNFYSTVGIASLVNELTGLGGPHSSFWTEIRANKEAVKFFGDKLQKDFTKYYPVK